ncbi:hypothetical protein D2V17_12770 [Aurantiacibacter xanthus]|uniref:Uncharacterized protein n=1 Tax=Aurantiacibacter xanthus TaxID=1784712 RepID=A0A3A1P2J6_9SPHN|nr:hypothetical protein [Aurantiacibacter xanthus]RIV83461.1 hypothetical protein D2V17_12770 [Aurantiacibacter xanthus]
MVKFGTVLIAFLWSLILAMNLHLLILMAQATTPSASLRDHILLHIIPPFLVVLALIGAGLILRRADKWEPQVGFLIVLLAIALFPFLVFTVGVV